MTNNELDGLFARFVEAGDARALDQFARHAVPLLLRWARHLGARHQADDLVQSTFVTLLSRHEQLDRSRPILPWLLGVLSRHWMRAKARERLRFEPAPERASQRSDPALIAEWRETSAMVRQTIEQMPALYRPVLTGFLQHELSPHELARLFGVSGSSTRSRLFRGLRLLRDRLQGMGCYAAFCFRNRGAELSPWSRSPRLLWAAACGAVLLVTGGLWLNLAEAGRVQDEPRVVARAASSPESPRSEPTPERRREVTEAGSVAPAPSRPAVQFTGVVLERDTQLPVADADLYLFELELRGPRPASRELQAVSDARGRFHFDRPWSFESADTRALVVARTPSGALGWAYAPPIGDAERIDLPVEIAPTLELSVRVEDARGLPIPEAEVEAAPVFPPWPSFGASLASWRTGEGLEELVDPFLGRTGGDGEVLLCLPARPRVSMRHAAPLDDDEFYRAGDYLVRASLPGHFVAGARVAPEPGRRNALTLVATPVGRLRAGGRVHDVGGAALVDAELRLLAMGAGSGPPRRLARSDARGDWDVPLESLPDAPIQIECRAPGWIPRTTMISSFPRGESLRLDFRLQPSRSRQGTVRDRHGRAVEGVLVQWIPVSAAMSDPRTVVSRDLLRLDLGVELAGSAGLDRQRLLEERGSTAAISDACGRFELEVPVGGGGLLFALPPEPFHAWRGATVVALPDAGQLDLTLHAALAPRRSLDVRVRDARDGSELRVTDAFLAPAPSQHEGLPPELRLLDRRLQVDRDRIRATELPPGDWILYVNVSGKAFAVEEFTVEADRALPLSELRVGERIEVQGRLRAEPGRALPSRLRFSLRPALDSLAPSWESAGPFVVAADLDAEGGFRISGLCPGAWVVEVAGIDGRRVEPPVLELGRDPWQQCELRLVRERGPGSD